ncbi:hydrogen gas-evolving membrane-bound hydrogenase subunit E [Acanthopleuribacter pedis]|uniref:DUF4040 domain-containing protein n=1 Tax=Acanthopleuribacter pedis TaxID=442870 RepID=A0A8J7QA05_9BACT|nr:hydrogen gas-evolving membrane-bound hydrogenase subunit E [Acanthopleuribacter pedis]MBO1322747.1 DUF4040 domain-containing protein [Acanthopleuribacter pedis]
MALPLIVVVGLLLSCLAPTLGRLLGQKVAPLLALFPAAVCLWLCATVLPNLDTPLLFEAPWIPSLNMSYAFHLDGLSALFMLFISAIGTFIFMYAGGYLGNHPQLGRLFAFLLLFFSAMLGLVIADDLILLFIFWELTSISSFFLIGFKHESEEARRSALQALLVTGAGGLALLAGLILLGDIGGTYRVSELLLRGDTFIRHPLSDAALLLILAGAFTKSAQFPFHFWLPGAMVAPTPISAFLHSATMVKAGIFLLARLHPLLSDHLWWTPLVAGAGAITMTYGALRSPWERDLKTILAYATVSVLGMLTMLLGLGVDKAIPAFVAVILAHAFYKASLFMVAGILDHQCGTRNIDELRGLRSALPITSVAAGLAAVSMMGIPPLFGFIAKEKLIEAALKAEWYGMLMIAAVFVSAACLTVSAWQVGFRPFRGTPKPTPKQAKEGGPLLWAGPLFFAILPVPLGLLVSFWSGPFFSAAVGAIQGQNLEMTVKLWYGFNLALLMSFLILGAGVGLTLKRDKITAYLKRTVYAKWPAAFHGAAVFQFGLKQAFALANAQTRILFQDALRHNLTFIMVVFLGLGFTILKITNVAWPFNPVPLDNPPLFELMIGLVIVAAIAAAIRAQSMVVAAACLGVVGFAVSCFFMIHGAIDLAITQLVIETLTVLLFVLVVHRFPDFNTKESELRRRFDALLAAASGAFMTLLIWKADLIQLQDPISGYFAENSMTKGYGQNVVNVILVDFRALDTLGEIVVLLIAALGVYSLTRQKLKKAKKATEGGAA